MPTQISAYELARLILAAAGERDAQSRIETLCYDEYPEEWEKGRVKAMELLNAWMPPASAGKSVQQVRSVGAKPI